MFKYGRIKKAELVVVLVYNESELDKYVLSFCKNVGKEHVRLQDLLIICNA